MFSLTFRQKKAILSETLFWYNGKFTMLKYGYNNGYSCRLLSRYVNYHL